MMDQRSENFPPVSFPRRGYTPFTSSLFNGPLNSYRRLIKNARTSNFKKHWPVTVSERKKIAVSKFAFDRFFYQILRF